MSAPKLPSIRRVITGALIFFSLAIAVFVGQATAASAATPVQAAQAAQSATAYSARSVTGPVLVAARLDAPLAVAPAVSAPSSPKTPTAPSVSVNVNPKPSTSVSIILLLTVISVAPSILLMMTAFTKIFVVLSLTRNALGLTGVPPNQVLSGLSLFLSLFVMGPVLKAVNTAGIQPYLKGTKSQSQAFHDGIAPLQTFMLHHTRSEEIALMLRAGHLPNPATPDKLELTTLIPAFVLSELRSAMIIGFVIFIPFLIIDMVVSSSLMSLGMMMLPPVSVSLPFKLLLFVLIDGWGLIINALVSSYNT
jgi:flagellar biosynthetic protein FliP